jgi:hypothetical protein
MLTSQLPRAPVTNPCNLPITSKKLRSSIPPSPFISIILPETHDQLNSFPLLKDGVKSNKPSESSNRIFIVRLSSFTWLGKYNKDHGQEAFSCKIRVHPLHAPHRSQVNILRCLSVICWLQGCHVPVSDVPTHVTCTATLSMIGAWFLCCLGTFVSRSTPSVIVWMKQQKSSNVREEIL